MNAEEREKIQAMEMKQRPLRPAVKLIGNVGNAFYILGACKRAAKEAGWTDERWVEFRTKATDGDYDRLLRVVMEYFDVE